MFEDQYIYSLTYDIKFSNNIYKFSDFDHKKNELKFIAGRLAHLRMVHFASLTGVFTDLLHINRLNLV